MTRDSPPELERELPGPQASISVTFAPDRNRLNAVQPPKAPAPITATCGLLDWALPTPKAATDDASIEPMKVRRRIGMKSDLLVIGRPVVPSRERA